MVDEHPEQAESGVSAEDRRRLRNDAVLAVRLLAESLDQADDPNSRADGRALLARVQAAIEPLRMSAAALTAEATLTAGPGPRRVAVALSAAASLTVAVNHVVHVRAQDTLTVLDSATATVTAQDAFGTTPPTTSTATGTVTWTGAEPGSAPQTFEVTPEDTPWILLQILLRLDDLANPDTPGVTIAQIYQWIVPLLGLLIALLPHLT